MKRFNPEILLDRCQADKSIAVFEKVFTYIVNFSIAVMVLILFMFISIEPVLIVGTSMENGLHDGDTVVINKFYSHAERGDVVIIDANDSRIIKRVIAIEGDKLAFCRETVTVDGNLYEIVALYIETDDQIGFIRQPEPYIKESMLYSRDVFVSIPVANSYEQMLENNIYVTVSKNNFIALGDNRNVSRDSRYYGQFSNSQLVGKDFILLKSDSFLSKFFDFFYSDNNTVNNN